MRNAKTPGICEVSTDRSRMDIEVIHGFLASSYWAKGISRSVIEKSIANSLCFGAFLDGKQAGFARVITDYSTFAYLSDVFVLPEIRGRGIGKLLMQAILKHPELQGLRRFLLSTDHAQGLYAQFGFHPLEHPERFMIIQNRNVDKNPVISK